MIPSIVFVPAVQHYLFSAACNRSGMEFSPNIPRYYTSLETQGTVRCKWAAIYCSRWRSSSC